MNRKGLTLTLVVLFVIGLLFVAFSYLDRLELEKVSLENKALKAEIASLTKALAENSAPVPVTNPATQTAEAVPVAMTIVGTYKITPRDLTLQEAIAAGKYDWINSHILSAPEFKSEPAVMSDEVTLVQFSRGISTEEVLIELASGSLRPAKIWELLAIGAERPELQGERPIVALGSFCVFDNKDLSPCLGISQGRVLSLASWGGGWPGYFRLLAVRLPVQTGK